MAYLAQHELFAQLPELQRDFAPPPYCTAHGHAVAKVSAWWGTEGTVTPLHFDSYHNVLTQAREETTLTPNTNTDPRPWTK